MLNGDLDNSDDLDMRIGLCIGYSICFVGSMHPETLNLLSDSYCMVVLKKIIRMAWNKMVANILYIWKLWWFGGLHLNCQIKICQFISLCVYIILW